MQPKILQTLSQTLVFSSCIFMTSYTVDKDGIQTREILLLVFGPPLLIIAGINDLHLRITHMTKARQCAHWIFQVFKRHKTLFYCQNKLLLLLPEQITLLSNQKEREIDRLPLNEITILLSKIFMRFSLPNEEAGPGCKSLGKPSAKTIPCFTLDHSTRFAVIPESIGENVLSTYKSFQDPITCVTMSQD